jgi:hypothetical protein
MAMDGRHTDSKRFLNLMLVKVGLAAAATLSWTRWSTPSQIDRLAIGPIATESPERAEMKTASRLFARHPKLARAALIMLAPCILLALGPAAHADEKPATMHNKFSDKDEGGNVYLAGV